MRRFIVEREGTKYIYGLAPCGVWGLSVFKDEKIRQLLFTSKRELIEFIFEEEETNGIVIKSLTAEEQKEYEIDLETYFGGD